jgi:hypothetical protein
MNGGNRRVATRARVCGLVGAAACLLLALLAIVPSALGDEELTIKEGTGVEFSEVVALAEGNQCPSVAATPSGSIEWGDGASSPAQSFEPDGVGAWHVGGKHSYAKPGIYEGSFSGSYKCGGSEAHFAAVPFTAEVTTTIRATAGVPFSGELAGVEIDDSEGTDCTGTAQEASGTTSWGDGEKSNLTGSEFIFEGEIALRVSGSHTYAATGHYEGTIAGEYKCLSGTHHLYKAKFSAVVEAAAQPAPPPQVHAAFAIQSVTAGKAVLDATASTPPGTSATLYSWNVTGGTQPDAVCQGSEPQLTVESGTALNTTVSLTAVDSTTGASTLAKLPLDIPGPALRKGAKISVASAQTASVPAALGKLVTPSFKVVSTCASKSLPASVPYKEALAAGKSIFTQGVGGAPSGSCLEDTEFGAADIEGCLNQVGEPSEIPGGVTIGLAKLLCGASLKDFCLPALSSVADEAVSTAGALLSRTARAHTAFTLPPPTKVALSQVLENQKFPVDYSTTPIRVNGLDIDPQNGFPILIMPAEDLVLAVDAKVWLHGVPLAVVPALVLHLPDVGGLLGELKLPKSVPIIGSLPFAGSISITLHRAGTKLSNGDTCQFDCAAIAVQAELPGVFSNGAGEGLRAGAVLTADNEQGLELDSFELKVPQADLGGIGVEEVEFKYLRGPDSLHGGATIDLGPVGDVGGTIDFIHGHFNGASLEYSAGDGEGIDLGGPIPIFLTKLGGGITLEPPVIEANGAIAGGPPVLGCALFGIEAEVVLDFQPEFTLNANGTGQFLCQNVSSEYFHIDEAGDIGLGAHVDIGFLIFKVSGGFNFNVAGGHFQADGEVNACIDIAGEHCLEAEAVVSDRGIGVCGNLGFAHAGGGIQFPDNPIIFFDSCDIGKFRSLGFTTSLKGSRAAASSFRIPHGQKVALIGLTGAAGAPRATLRGPSGRTIVTPASGYEKTADEVVISDEQSATKETYVFINHPEAGAWTVTPTPGSAPITAIQQAASLPAPAVHAKVSPAGAHRERLTYSLHPIPGQTVEFAERKAGGDFRLIGKAHGVKGRLVFTPSPVLGTKRTIEAMVSEEGHPREDVTVASFRVASTRLPAPGHLRVRRHGETLTVSFKGVKGASGYAVGVRLSDGRSLFVKLSAAHHQAAVAQVPANVSGRVQVAALLPGTRLREGRQARLSFRSASRAAPTVVRTES